jgi:hypothetical protein
VQPEPPTLRAGGRPASMTRARRVSAHVPGDRYGPSMAVRQAYVVPVSRHLLFPTAGVTHHLLAVRTSRSIVDRNGITTDRFTCPGAPS